MEGSYIGAAVLRRIRFFFEKNNIAKMDTAALAFRNHDLTNAVDFGGARVPKCVTIALWNHTLTGAVGFGKTTVQKHVIVTLRSQNLTNVAH